MSSKVCSESFERTPASKLFQMTGVGKENDNNNRSLVVVQLSSSGGKVCELDGVDRY